MSIASPLPSHHAPGADRLLWSRLQRGDRNALNVIYTDYLDSLYNYARRITPDKSLVEDCLQDLFVEIWNKREVLGDVHNIKLYLIKAIRHKIINQLVSKRRMVERDDLSHFEMEVSDKSHFLKQETDAELSVRLKAMVDSLTPKQKEAVYLIYFQELSYDEASIIMGLKIKTVYNLVNLAIGKLREKKDFLIHLRFLL